MSENSQDFFTNLDWNEVTEELLVSWADIAMCYTWIYERAYRQLSGLNYKFSIPIIIFSTITGTVGIGLSSLVPADYVQTGQNIIGAVNIFTGIITTLQNFFRYAQQSELALTATTDWAKFYRNIKIELSIERHNRKKVTEFVRSTRQEYERLLNTRPIIPPDIIQQFYTEFESSDVIKPEVLDKVHHLKIFNDTNTVSYYRSAQEHAKEAVERKASISSNPNFLQKFTRKLTSVVYDSPSSRSVLDKIPEDSSSSSKESSPSLLKLSKIKKNIDRTKYQRDGKDGIYLRSSSEGMIISRIEENSRYLKDIKDKYLVNKDDEKEIELTNFRVHPDVAEDVSERKEERKEDDYV